MMNRSRVAISLLAIVLALVIQTTVFGANGIQPLGVAPAFVTLVVIAIGPYVEAEYHVLLGFTAGLLTDLMGSGTLGLWAMTLTIVAYATVRLRERFNEGILLTAFLVFSLTLLGQLVFVTVATLFGQEVAADTSVVAKVLLPAVWNLALAIPVVWGLALVFRNRDRRWAT
jgi:rod shape-determining protein MreD